VNLHFLAEFTFESCRVPLEIEICEYSTGFIHKPHQYGRSALVIYLPHLFYFNPWEVTESLTDIVCDFIVIMINLVSRRDLCKDYLFDTFPLFGDLICIVLPLTLVFYGFNLVQLQQATVSKSL
jgi:hypothetical protein